MSAKEVKNEEILINEECILLKKDNELNDQEAYITTQGNCKKDTQNAQYGSIPEAKAKDEQLSFQISENTTEFDVYKGIVYMLISCTFRSFFSFLCKWSLNYNKELTSFQQITIFNYFYFTTTLFTFMFGNVSIFSEKFVNGKKFGLVIIRNLLAISSMLFLTYSLKFLHISDVFSVFFIYPAIVIIFSVVFLGEKTWWFDYICCLSCFTGALLIVKPDFMFHGNPLRSNESYLFFFGLVIVAAIFKACEDVVTRFIGKDMHYQAINLFYSSIGMLVFPLILCIFNQPIPKISLFEIFIFMITGISAWVYQTYATMAFQNENAGRVSMINYLQVDFMYVIDLIIFNKPLLFTDLMGTLLIFSFNFANGLYKTFKRITILNREIQKRKRNQNYDKKLQNYTQSPKRSAELDTGNSNKNNMNISSNLV